MVAAAKRRLVWKKVVILGVLGLGVAAPAGECLAETFQLSISGDPGARYRGACTLTAASGDERIEIEGGVPLQRTFEGDALTCRLAAEGRIVVEIGHAGGRSRSASSGGVIQVSAR